MLKKDDIKNGALIYNKDDNTYHIMSEVGNAYNKGNREYSSNDNKELSYSLLNVVTNDVQDGICEHSHMTSTTLCPATEKEVKTHLLKVEGDVLQILGKAKKKYALIMEAINRFEKTIIN